MGGIYFWLHLRDAIEHAKGDGDNPNFFLVSRPSTPPQIFQYSIDHLMSRRDIYVNHDAILRGVDTYLFNGKPHLRDEFVKAGSIRGFFQPYLMLKLRR